MRNIVQQAALDLETAAEVRAVDVGAKEGESWIIKSGLQAGEHVVSEGVAKVRDGMPVTPKPDSYKSNGA